MILLYKSIQIVAMCMDMVAILFIFSYSPLWLTSSESLSESFEQKKPGLLQVNGALFVVETIYHSSTLVLQL